MKRILLGGLMFISFHSFSQKATSFKPVFRLTTSGGITIGQQKISPLFQVIPGLYYQRFSLGVGAGFDDYRFRSIPFFADVRYNFGRRDFGFIYSDLGYNFPFKVRTEKNSFLTTDRYEGGFYGDFGIGLKLFSNRRHALLFSAGYSIKEIRNIQGFPSIWGFPTVDETINRYHFSMGRIVSKLSWQFGR